MTDARAGERSGWNRWVALGTAMPAGIMAAGGIVLAAVSAATAMQTRVTMAFVALSVGAILLPLLSQNREVFWTLLFGASAATMTWVLTAPGKCIAVVSPGNVFPDRLSCLSLIGFGYDIARFDHPPVLLAGLLSVGIGCAVCAIAWMLIRIARRRTESPGWEKRPRR